MPEAFVPVAPEPAQLPVPSRGRGGGRDGSGRRVTRVGSDHRVPQPPDVRHCHVLFTAITAAACSALRLLLVIQWVPANTHSI